MPVFFFKSLLSIIVILLVLIATFTMFEVLGRNEKRYKIEKMKRIHRINGLVFLAMYVFISYLCLNYIYNTKVEPSPRATFHSMLGLAIAILLPIKIAYIRFYKQFYDQVKNLGLLLAIISLGLIGTSAGYYLLITKFGAESIILKKQEERGMHLKDTILVRTDQEAIQKGKELYFSKCHFCHDPYSTQWGVGPGHKGIMKNPTLPVSKKPATPENIAEQIRNPYKDMPSFSYLSDKEIEELVAFMKTL